MVYEAQDGTVRLVTIVNGNVTSTSVTTGTMVLNGGVGFSGDVYGTTFKKIKILSIDGYTYNWKDKKMRWLRVRRS